MGQPSIDLFASHHTTPSWRLTAKQDFFFSPVSLIAGISEKSEKVIANVKYKYASTQGSYESAWNKWASWCKLRQIDLFWCCKINYDFSSEFVQK